MSKSSGKTAPSESVKIPSSGFHGLLRYHPEGLASIFDIEIGIAGKTLFVASPQACGFFDRDAAFAQGGLD